MGARRDRSAELVDWAPRNWGMAARPAACEDAASPGGGARDAAPGGAQRSSFTGCQPSRSTASDWLQCAVQSSLESDQSPAAGDSGIGERTGVSAVLPPPLGVKECLRASQRTENGSRHPCAGRIQSP